LNLPMPFLLIRAVACGGLFFTAVFCSPSPAAAPRPAQPNFLYILTDDQGYGDLGAHGHPLLRTPHLDQLREQSVRFENFYVSPSCSPTRAALLTGMHEFRNGVTHTLQPREHLWGDAVTLPELLDRAGYATGFIGKWHLGDDAGYAPSDRGFQWCSTNQGGPREHFDPVFIRNGRRSEEKGYREDVYFDDAMKFITLDDTKPWFLWLATYSPHDPLAAPEEFIAPFRGKGLTENEELYLAMLANLDMNVGRIMTFLDETDDPRWPGHKLRDNTVVVFMNDNGNTWGLDVYNGGMRGCKCTIWHGGSRAISLWSWPGVWPARSVGELTAHLDFLPTICQLAGAKIPPALRPELEGFSLVPLLQGKGWAHDDRRLFQHVARWPSGMAADHKYAMAGVRQGDYLMLRSRPCDRADCTVKVRGDQCATLRAVEKGQKFAQYTKADAAYHWGVTPPGEWELYDTTKDPACRENLAPAQTGRVAALAAAYDTWWDGVFPVMVERGGDAPMLGDGRGTPARP
jgi:arylsulfatase A-like enzyme